MAESFADVKNIYICTNQIVSCLLKQLYLSIKNFIKPKYLNLN